MSHHLHAVLTSTLDPSPDGGATCARCSEDPRRCRVHGRTLCPAPAQRDREIVTLVRAAQAGGDAAWARLVERFDRQVRGIARSYRLTPADVDDVTQSTYLRLFNNIAHLREPAALPGWLATTTRRESLRLLQLRSHEQLTDDPELGERADAEEPEARLLAAERHAALHRALAALPERHRRLMTMLAADSAVDYEQIGARLAMPKGSIGPIRGRCLTRLERDPGLRALCASPSQRPRVSAAAAERS